MLGGETPGCSPGEVELGQAGRAARLAGGPGGSGFLRLSWRAVERSCAPLLFPHIFLSRADWCGLGWRKGAGPPQPSPPLGPSDPFPTPAPPNYTQHLLPHLGRCSLTFSRTATTLQPLSCSRAELSVRMGRSLRLLKPCRGRREPRSGLRVSPTQPRPSQQAVGRAPAARRAVATEGRTRVQAGPTSQGQTEQRSWPWSRVARPPSQLGPPT